jgi:TonB family protein
MYKTIFATFILFFSAITISPQNINTNCPELFTRSKVRNPSINIIKFEVLDSIKYTTQPTFIIDKDSLEKLMMYPEIAKRAGVEGFVVIRVQIDEKGKSIQANVVKAIGAGCDEAALDVLLKSKYHPAKIKNKKVESVVEVWVSFFLAETIDKPDLILTEIIYEDNSLYKYKKLTLDEAGDANYMERDKTTGPGHKLLVKKNGKISTDTYERLNDFIISQCFLKYKNYYYYSASDHTRRETITIKTDSFEKYVRSIGNGDPVGLWAIINILRHIDEQIQWEEVKE